MELTADDEGSVAEGGESGALVVDVRLQRVRLGALPLDVLFDCEEDVAGLNVRGQLCNLLYHANLR